MLMLKALLMTRGSIYTIHIYYHYGSRPHRTIPNMILDGFGDLIPQQ